MKLFKTTVNRLRKLSSLTYMFLTPSGKQIICNSENQIKVREAAKLIDQAANLLDSIK